MIEDAGAEDDGVKARGRGKRPAQGEAVVDRAFALLACFGPTRRRLSLAELSRVSGIPTSSTLRLATQLMGWGALERDADGRFCIGMRLYELASLSPRGQGLREVALPFMGDLEQTMGHHVLLAVRSGTDALLVERLSSHQATPVLYRVGGRMPLHSTGVGLALLAFAPMEFIEDYLTRPLVHTPEGRLVDTDALRRELADVRRARAVTFRRSVPSPILSVAAPVFDESETVVAGLSVVVPDTTVDAPRLVLALQTAARSISRCLGAKRSIGLV